MVTTTTAVRFEPNPDWYGALLEITHNKDLDWDGHVTFRALYPQDMELVKRRNPFWLRIINTIENTLSLTIKGIGKVILLSIGISSGCFVFTVLLYVLKVFGIIP